MNTKNVAPLTPFQKDIIKQVLHDEIENNVDSNLALTAEFVDETLHKIEKSVIMAVGIKQARENDFWNKVEDIKKKVTFTIKQV